MQMYIPALRRALAYLEDGRPALARRQLEEVVGLMARGETPPPGLTPKPRRRYSAPDYTPKDTA